MDFRRWDCVGCQVRGAFGRSPTFANPKHILSDYKVDMRTAMDCLDFAVVVPFELVRSGTFAISLADLSCTGNRSLHNLLCDRLFSRVDLLQRHFHHPLLCCHFGRERGIDFRAMVRPLFFGRRRWWVPSYWVENLILAADWVS